MAQISVIIPTYNRKEMLRKALESVLAQKDIPRHCLDICVIDDGSDDGTKKMMGAEFSDIQYVFFENKGPAAARNRGLELTSSDWIAFLDSDDIWHPEKIKKQLAFFKANSDIKICQTQEIWIRKGKRVNQLKKHKKYAGWVFERCLALCMISPSSVMFHRDILDTVGFFDESLPACEDYDLWLRISAKFQVGLVGENLITKFGGHADQRSYEFEAMDKFRIRALANTLTSGLLTTEQAELARLMLEEKTNIYLQGATKRNKPLDKEVEALFHGSF